MPNDYRKILNPFTDPTLPMKRHSAVPSGSTALTWTLSGLALAACDHVPYLVDINSEANRSLPPPPITDGSNRINPTFAEGPAAARQVGTIDDPDSKYSEFEVVDKPDLFEVRNGNVLWYTGSEKVDFEASQTLEVMIRGILAVSEDAPEGGEQNFLPYRFPLTNVNDTEPEIMISPSQFHLPQGLFGQETDTGVRITAVDNDNEPGSKNIDVIPYQSADILGALGDFFRIDDQGRLLIKENVTIGSPTATGQLVVDLEFRATDSGEGAAGSAANTVASETVRLVFAAQGTTGSPGNPGNTEPTIIVPNSAPSGLNRVTADLVGISAGDTVSVNVSSLDDADGIPTSGSGAPQWTFYYLADENALDITTATELQNSQNVTEFQGSGTSFTMVEAAVGKRIYALVSYTDDTNNPETGFVDLGRHDIGQSTADGYTLGRTDTDNDLDGESQTVNAVVNYARDRDLFTFSLTSEQVVTISHDDSAATAIDGNPAAGIEISLLTGNGLPLNPAVTIGSDSNADIKQTLAAGAYQVRVDSGTAVRGSYSLTISAVTGTANNEQPALTALTNPTIAITDGTVSFVGSEASGTNEGYTVGSSLPLTGVFSATDADGNTLTFKVSIPGGSVTASDRTADGFTHMIELDLGKFHYNENSAGTDAGKYEFEPDQSAISALDDADDPSYVFSVTVDDGTGASNSVSAPRNLTFTFDGMNDTPIAWEGGQATTDRAATATISKDAGVRTSTGFTLSVEDNDGDDGFTQLSFTGIVYTGNTVPAPTASTDSTDTANYDANVVTTATIGSYGTLAGRYGTFYFPPGNSGDVPVSYSVGVGASSARMLEISQLGSGATLTEQIVIYASDGASNSAPVTLVLTISGSADVNVRPTLLTSEDVNGQFINAGTHAENIGEDRPNASVGVTFHLADANDDVATMTVRAAATSGSTFPVSPQYSSSLGTGIAAHVTDTETVAGTYGSFSVSRLPTGVMNAKYTLYDAVTNFNRGTATAEEIVQQDGYTAVQALNQGGALFEKLTVYAHDGALASSAFDYTVTIDGANDVSVNTAPTSTADTDISVVETDTAGRSFSIADFNYYDADGDPLVSITITEVPSTGELRDGSTVLTSSVVPHTITAENIGNLIFVPAADTGGTTVMFKYTVSDGTASSPESTLTIEIKETGAPVIGSTLTDATPSDPNNNDDDDMVLEDSSDSTVTGAISIADPDDGQDETNSILYALGDADSGNPSGSPTDSSATGRVTVNPSGSGSTGTVAGKYGDFVITRANGATTWTYTLDNEKEATNSLALNERVTDTMRVVVYDNSMPTPEASNVLTITVNIDGANEANNRPAVSVLDATITDNEDFPLNPANENDYFTIVGSDLSTTGRAALTGEFAVTDLDVADTHTFAVVGSTAIDASIRDADGTFEVDDIVYNRQAVKADGNGVLYFNDGMHAGSAAHAGRYIYIINDLTFAGRGSSVSGVTEVFAVTATDSQGVDNPGGNDHSTSASVNLTYTFNGVNDLPVIEFEDENPSLKANKEIEVRSFFEERTLPVTFTIADADAGDTLTGLMVSADARGQGSTAPATPGLDDVLANFIDIPSGREISVNGAYGIFYLTRDDQGVVMLSYDLNEGSADVLALATNQLLYEKLTVYVDDDTVYVDNDGEVDHGHLTPVTYTVEIQGDGRTTGRIWSTNLNEGRYIGNAIYHEHNLRDPDNTNEDNLVLAQNTTYMTYYSHNVYRNWREIEDAYRRGDASLVTNHHDDHALNFNLLPDMVEKQFYVTAEYTDDVGNYNKLFFDLGRHDLPGSESGPRGPDGILAQKIREVNDTGFVYEGGGYAEGEAGYENGSVTGYFHSRGDRDMFEFTLFGQGPNSRDYVYVTYNGGAGDTIRIRFRELNADHIGVQGGVPNYQNQITLETGETYTLSEDYGVYILEVIADRVGEYNFTFEIADNRPTGGVLSPILGQEFHASRPTKVGDLVWFEDTITDVDWHPHDLSLEGRGAFWVDGGKSYAVYFAPDLHTNADSLLAAVGRGEGRRIWDIHEGTAANFNLTKYTMEKHFYVITNFTDQNGNSYQFFNHAGTQDAPSKFETRHKAPEIETLTDTGYVNGSFTGWNDGGGDWDIYRFEFYGFLSRSPQFQVTLDPDNGTSTEARILFTNINGGFIGGYQTITEGMTHTQTLRGKEPYYLFVKTNAPGKYTLDTNFVDNEPSGRIFSRNLKDKQDPGFDTARTSIHGVFFEDTIWDRDGHYPGRESFGTYYSTAHHNDEGSLRAAIRAGEAWQIRDLHPNHPLNFQYTDHMTEKHFFVIKAFTDRNGVNNREFVPQGRSDASPVASFDGVNLSVYMKDFNDTGRLTGSFNAFLLHPLSVDTVNQPGEIDVYRFEVTGEHGVAQRIHFHYDGGTSGGISVEVTFADGTDRKWSNGVVNLTEASPTTFANYQPGHYYVTVRPLYENGRYGSNSGEYNFRVTNTDLPTQGTITASTIHRPENHPEYTGEIGDRVIQGNTLRDGNGIPGRVGDGGLNYQVYYTFDEIDISGPMGWQRVEAAYAVGQADKVTEHINNNRHDFLLTPDMVEKNFYVIYWYTDYYGAYYKQAILLGRQDLYSGYDNGNFIHEAEDISDLNGTVTSSDQDGHYNGHIYGFNDDANGGDRDYYEFILTETQTITVTYLGGDAATMRVLFLTDWGGHHRSTTNKDGVANDRHNLALGDTATITLGAGRHHLEIHTNAYGKYHFSTVVHGSGESIVELAPRAQTVDISEHRDTSDGIKVTDLVFVTASGYDVLTIIGEDAPMFELRNRQSELWLKADVTLNHEADPQLIVQVEGTSTNTAIPAIRTVPITVNVVNANDLPLLLSDLSARAATITDGNRTIYPLDDTGSVDGAAGGGSEAVLDSDTNVTGDAALKGQLNSSDQDSSDTLTYAVEGGHRHPAGTVAFGTDFYTHRVTLDSGMGTLHYNENADISDNPHSGKYYYVPNEGAITRLNSGETITETFRVSVRDGTGSSAVQDLTYTIVGANDAPLAWRHDHDDRSSRPDAYNPPDVSADGSSGNPSYRLFFIDADDGDFHGDLNIRAFSRYSTATTENVDAPAYDARPEGVHIVDLGLYSTGQGPAVAVTNTIAGLYGTFSFSRTNSVRVEYNLDEANETVAALTTGQSLYDRVALYVFDDEAGVSEDVTFNVKIIPAVDFEAVVTGFTFNRGGTVGGDGSISGGTRVGNAHDLQTGDLVSAHITNDPQTEADTTPTYTYQWTLNGSNISQANGGTAQNYVLRADDTTGLLSVTVTYADPTSSQPNSVTPEDGIRLPVLEAPSGSQGALQLDPSYDGYDDLADPMIDFADGTDLDII